ncbi:hypothetical protein DSO57_1015777 [Entomophthora muscae]|uniref:Uncharacterized protein n=1 Tax=Entomophthora muscae TaxID=34485 RepID=A0ACC2T4X8_9FUNG|nr:hypothetical protein DSO57_1015777 [Entomophthora muscae]
MELKKDGSADLTQEETFGQAGLTTQIPLRKINQALGESRIYEPPQSGSTSDACPLHLAPHLTRSTLT